MHFPILTPEGGSNPMGPNSTPIQPYGLFKPLFNLTLSKINIEKKIFLLTNLFVAHLQYKGYIHPNYIASHSLSRIKLQNILY